MLQLMLHAHPRIAIPPETRFVLTGYGVRHRFGDLRKPERRRALADWIFTEETKVADLGLDRDEVTAAQVRESSASRRRTCWERAGWVT